MAQNNQLENIQRLRKDNYTYASIGKVLGMSVNTVKSICRKYGFAPDDVPQKDINHIVSLEAIPRCKFCGRAMDNPWNRRNKKFCTDQCRYNWWNRKKRVLNYNPSEPLEDLSRKTLDFLPQKRD